MYEKGKILIIDDLQDHRMEFKESLEDKGFKAYLANSGLAAIKKINKFRFDGIVVDMRMEPLDGIETMKRIRELGNHVPTVGITATI